MWSDTNQRYDYDETNRNEIQYRIFPIVNGIANDVT